MLWKRPPPAESRSAPFGEDEDDDAAQLGTPVERRIEESV
jgi:hypothetical protein